MSEQEFVAGHVFFSTGDAADCAWQLRAGEVEVLADIDGEPTCVGRYAAGDVFGEMALIEDRPRTCTARAVSPGRVTSLTREQFAHRLSIIPSHTRPYVHALFDRLKSRAAASGSEAEFKTAPRVEPEATTPSASPIPLAVGSGTASDWVVVLHPLTHKAAETLPAEGLLIAQFPLRIGRASDSRETEAQTLNDLWLLDQKPYHVSRNHCEIVIDGEGPLVRDRGSHLGCLVNDRPIGGRIALDSARLQPGENVLVIGSRMSKYQFRVIVGPNADA